MDRSRKANRQVNEVTLQHTSRTEALLNEEMVEARLIQLQGQMEQLQQTPAGAAEFQRRVKAFGECQRGEEETSRQFVEKLSRWLGRDLLQTKMPLHPPRQVAD